jgi:hypothetical protein
MSLIDGDKYYQGKMVTTEDRVILTGDNAQGEIIPFGCGLAKGTNDDDLVLPSATGFTFMGVALATDTIEKRDGYSLTAGGEMGWPITYRMSYWRRGGVIAVPIDSDCAKGGSVYCIHTASSGQVPGHFRKDANTDQADLVPGLVFWKTFAAAGIGLLRSNLP